MDALKRLLAKEWKKNDDAKRVLFQKSNKWDAAKDILLTESRQWELKEHERKKAAYMKRNHEYWDVEISRARKERKKNAFRTFHPTGR